MRFEASGRLIIQWPTNAGSSSLNAEGRAAFCLKVAQALEGRQLALQASERVRGLHPELTATPMGLRAERVSNTAILLVTAQGADQKYVRVYLNALLDEFEAFYIGTSQKATGDSLSKTIDEVLGREVAVKKKIREWQDFMKAHPSDFDAQDNKVQREALTSELKHLDENYHNWKSALQGLSQVMETPVPNVSIMERPFEADRVK
jgi:hypothetical protein